MKKILKSFEINTSGLVAGGETRIVSFKGDVGAKFMFQVISESTGFPKFLDFVNGGFQTMDFNTNSNKMIELIGNSHTETITFPAATGTTYTILVIASENSDTFILNGRDKVASKKISQVSNVTVTFQAASASSSNYETFPTTTSTGSPSSSSLSTVSIDHTISNKDNDANGFGLRFVANHAASVKTLTSTSASLTDSVYYFETTEAVGDNPAGDGEDSTTVTVASLTDLAVGMTLYYHKATTVPTNKAGSAVGTTTITAIDTVTKTITFSQAVAFEDTETMTFRAYGFKSISKAIGLFLSAKGNSLATSKALTKTVRSDVSSSTTITLNGTRGVSGGNFVTYTGLGVDNSSTNTVTTNRTDGSTATASASAGEIIVTNAQTLTAGTVLTFDGCVSALRYSHTSFSITQYPSANRTINIDLDRFITVGVQNA